MTEITIKKNDKGSWDVVCMSGFIEGTYTELANAEFYCNECGYTWEVII
jgi:hypothetical protein